MFHPVVIAIIESCDSPCQDSYKMVTVIVISVSDSWKLCKEYISFCVPSLPNSVHSSMNMSCQPHDLFDISLLWAHAFALNCINDNAALSEVVIAPNLASGSPISLFLSPFDIPQVFEHHMNLGRSGKGSHCFFFALAVEEAMYLWVPNSSEIAI